MRIKSKDDLAVIVPFRLASERFPDKALVRYKGRPLLERAVENAVALTRGKVVVTAPAEDLRRAEEQVDLGPYDVELVPSALSCRSATERVLEIFSEVDADLFLSLPIDEPEIEPEEITGGIERLSSLADVDAVTFCCDFFCAEDYLSFLSAKVVTDAQGLLLYMSRAVVPVRKDGSVDTAALKKNVGAFLFKRDFLTRLAAKRDQPTMLDRCEGLEQLRWLELGFRVRVVKIAHIGFGIDVPDQLELLERRCAT